jgi:SpoVK/Ycf46/Vps4 family AAA+-type ATPase
VTLDDLGGINDCIQEVLELIVMPLKHPEIYAHTGVQPPRYTVPEPPADIGVFYYMALLVVGKLYSQMLWLGWHHCVFQLM